MPRPKNLGGNVCQCSMNAKQDNSDSNTLRIWLGRVPNEEELYRYQERLGVLCGQRHPTPEQVRIAVNEVREYQQDCEIYERKN